MRIQISLLTAIISTQLIACDASVQATSTTFNSSTTNNIGSATTSAPIVVNDTPYNYANDVTSACWENAVRTNGQSYGDVGNTGYYCTGGGASYGIYPDGVTWFGFYRDGSVSVRDKNGIDQVYQVALPGSMNAFGSPSITCEANLSLGAIPAIIMARVNYGTIPTTVLDGRNHLAYVELQTKVSGALDSGSVWSCTYKTSFGVQ